MQIRKLLFLAFIWILPAQATQIYLPEDEIILPPLLNDIQSGGEPEDRFNVTAVDQHPHEVKKGEWLDFGDHISLSARLSFQIIQRESIQWVGGGVFQGEIGTGAVAKTDFTYDVKVGRGWIKAWIKPDASHSTFKVITDSVTFIAKDATFWLTARPDRTEVYLIQGELSTLSGPTLISGRNYATFEKGKVQPVYLSKDWDLGAMEVKIAGSFPQLIKLANRAQEEWDGDHVEQMYGDRRKKGWRKASRFDPQTK